MIDHGHCHSNSQRMLGASPEPVMDHSSNLGATASPGHLPGHSHLAHADTTGRLRISLGFTLLVLVAEVVGGALAHSLALMSDAVHMLTDVGALGLAWYAQVQAAKPATDRHTYGFHRAGIMAAMINGVTLVVVSLGIAWEAVLRIEKPPAVHAEIMLVVAAVALVVNLVVAWMLAPGRENNLNVRSAVLHVLGDAAASAGVIVGAIIISIRPDWSIVDPVLSLGIAAVILLGTRQIFAEALNVLMEGTPSGLDSDEVSACIAGVPGVRAVHHLHIWSLAPGLNALSGHAVIDDQSISQAGVILAGIHKALRARFDVRHATIQFEDQQCGVDCNLSP
jgi:cobalt-zinc-cadmium efflux system protein